MNSQAGGDVEQEDRACRDRAAVAAFRLCYLDNVTASGVALATPTTQDTGNPIILRLMVGKFTLLFFLCFFFFLYTFSSVSPQAHLCSRLVGLSFYQGEYPILMLLLCICLHTFFLHFFPLPFRACHKRDAETRRYRERSGRGQ